MSERATMAAAMALLALGISLLALGFWIAAQDFEQHLPPDTGVPGPSVPGASWPQGAPAWAHTCDGIPPDTGCPLPSDDR